MVKTYQRALNEKDKRLIEKEIKEAQPHIWGNWKFVISVILFQIVLVTLCFYFPKWYVILPLSIMFIIPLPGLISEFYEAIHLPGYLKEKKKILHSGLVTVKEFNIDRYLRIKSYRDEGDHFILEYKGMMTMIGGQDFDGIRVLTNKIEIIEVTDIQRKMWFHERIEKHGEKLKPVLTFKKRIPDALADSTIWDNLLDDEPVPGSLDDVIPYLS